MDFSGVIKVEYWAEKKADTNELFKPEGIEEFRTELSQHYISAIHARPGPCGGLYGLVIEFITSFSLHHFVNLILDGVAYDLIKSGSDALVLRPFIAAYNALKSRNLKPSPGPRTRVHIERVLLTFNDSVVVIHGIGEDIIVNNLEPILTTLARNYAHLILQTGERPFSISVPVFEDMSEDRFRRFRELLDVDEIIRDLGDEDYLFFWGIQYDYLGVTRVFDVRSGALLDEEFYTQSMYRWAWENRRNRSEKPT